MVYDNRKIMRNYLRGWFGLDVFTVLPFDLLFAGIASAARMTIDANMFRLLRMLRLLKLARILRASRIISRWQDHISVSFALMSLVKFSFLIMVLAHWLACLWGFVSVKWSELPEETMAASTGTQNASSVWAGYHSQMSWRQKAGVPDTTNEYELYGMCIYVALNNASSQPLSIPTDLCVVALGCPLLARPPVSPSSTPSRLSPSLHSLTRRRVDRHHPSPLLCCAQIFGGSCEIHPGNFIEFYVQAAMLLTGSSVWAYVSLSSLSFAPSEGSREMRASAASVSSGDDGLSISIYRASYTYSSHSGRSDGSDDDQRDRAADVLR